MLDLDFSQLKQYFAAREDMVLAYLFGSRVKGNALPSSDYDIAVLTDPLMKPAQRYHMAHDLSKLLADAPVDLVPLNRAPEALAFNVITTGKLLYERSLAARVEYEGDAMSRYYDVVVWRRALREDVMRGGLNARAVQRNREALGKTERMLAEARADAQQKPG